MTASVAHGTVLSRHLRELEVLQHELHDCITGGVVYRGKQSDLKLGLDVDFQARKFYARLNGTSNYYCVMVEDGLAMMPSSIKLARCSGRWWQGAYVHSVTRS